jgi:hypothetical protein
MDFLQQVRRAVNPAKLLRLGMQDPDVRERKLLISVRQDQVRETTDPRFFLEPLQIQEGRITQDAILPKMGVARDIGRQR